MAIADVAAVKRRGFTLIELLVAIAVLALIFLLGMPSFTTFMRNSDIRSTSESIVNGLRTASAVATRRNSRVAFTLLDTNGGWLIQGVASDDTDCTKFDAADPIQRFAAEETRTGAKATATPAGKSTVCFTGLGRVFNQGAGDHLRQVDITRSDGGEGRPLRIIVDDPDLAKLGGLRLCDPDPALAALVPADPRAC